MTGKFVVKFYIRINLKKSFKSVNKKNQRMIKNMKKNYFVHFLKERFTIYLSNILPISLIDNFLKKKF